MLDPLKCLAGVTALGDTRTDVTIRQKTGALRKDARRRGEKEKNELAATMNSDGAKNEQFVQNS